MVRNRNRLRPMSVMLMTTLHRVLQRRFRYRRGPDWTPRVEALENRSLLSIFAAPISFPVSTGPTLVVVGDFNGESREP